MLRNLLISCSSYSTSKFTICKALWWHLTSSRITFNLFTFKALTNPPPPISNLVAIYNCSLPLQPASKRHLFSLNYRLISASKTSPMLLPTYGNPCPTWLNYFPLWVLPQNQSCFSTEPLNYLKPNPPLLSVPSSFLHINPHLDWKSLQAGPLQLLSLICIDLFIQCSSHVPSLSSTTGSCSICPTSSVCPSSIVLITSCLDVQVWFM